MIKLLLLVLSIYCVYCTMDECNECTNQNLCNSIDVGNENFYCFKTDFPNSDVKSKCQAFPKEAEHQKLYFQLNISLTKELFSCYANDYISSYGEENAIEVVENSLFKAEKEFYDVNEVVKIIGATLSSEDKEILKSDKTCAYYFYGRYAQNSKKKYREITDRKICFNAMKFKEFENLVDCGYAIVKFNVNGEDYEFKTCHFVPTSNLPKISNDIFTNYLVGEDIEELMYNDLFLHISDKYHDDENIITYEIEVENKYGRKVKYSKKNNQKNFEIIAEGVKGR